MSREPALRPRGAGIGPVVLDWGLPLAPHLFRFLRRVRPLLRVPGSGTVIATLHDDVREVFLDEDAFGTTYEDRLDVIMGGQPFFLGLDDRRAHARQAGAMRRAVLPGDIPALAAEVEEKAEEIVAASNGRIEVVDDLVRTVTFDVLCRYLGITDPPEGSLRVWATRLFEFQFADVLDDPALRAEAKVVAPKLRAHIQSIMDERRVGGALGDDVLGRCLAMQAQGDPDLTDDLIRTGLTGLAVGGPPQPPMVVPQAMEQLLRRPEALAGAAAAARAGDDGLLAGYVTEAMRFDPLGPALPRVARKDCVLARGTKRETKVAKGAGVTVAFSSAMFDGRRVPDPYRFDPRRLPHEYIHYGHGLHTCFGLHINRAVLHLMLKPLLRRARLRRAAGREGRLSKRGLFAERLVVEFG